MYSCILFNIQNSTWSKKCSVLQLEAGKSSIKLRRSIYLKLEEFHAIQLQKSSMLFVFNDKYQAQIIEVAQAIKNQGGEVCIFKVSDELGCIEKIVESGYQADHDLFKSVLDKAANQKRKNKAEAQLQNILDKWLAFLNFYSPIQRKNMQILIDRMLLLGLTNIEVSEQFISVTLPEIDHDITQ